ncbi:hypothetical protein [Sphingomonas qomolangmaensis]|uniref:Uncharacterized protein n=1 Tax=Sphingomonas qomolangmaensis TaxID=2918765 RepID=A0ABY5L8A6_9SPHN|nr:hypothetical protein [Sphingomonas qomolangmaensis]UUL83200.1 hypothetical protein NMP03_02905 [Sphingomonas qomolangmaensis]
MVAIVGMGVLAGLPPQRGRILMVPLDGTSAGAMAALARAAGGSLVATGGWPGSLIVESPLTALRGQTQGRAILLLRAPGAGCGSETVEKA